MNKKRINFNLLYFIVLAATWPFYYHLMLAYIYNSSDTSLFHYDKQMDYFSIVLLVAVLLFFLIYKYYKKKKNSDMITSFGLYLLGPISYFVFKFINLDVFGVVGNKLFIFTTLPLLTISFLLANTKP